MSDQIDWTGIRAINDRCRHTPGHPMNTQEQRMKTMADHARAYRQRKAAKIARYEAALREIAAAGIEQDARPAELVRISLRALGDAA
jgi:hypothetical protein